MSNVTITAREELLNLKEIQLITMLSESNVMANRIYFYKLKEILDKHQIPTEVNLEDTTLLKVNADFMYLSLVFTSTNGTVIELEDLTKEQIVDIICMVCEETGTSYLVSYDGTVFEYNKGE